MGRNTIAVVILAYCEEMHVACCIELLRGVGRDIRWGFFHQGQDSGESVDRRPECDR